MIINQRFSYLFLAYYILVDSIKNVNGHGIHAHNSSKILDLLYYFLFFFNTFKKWNKNSLFIDNQSFLIEIKNKV